MRNTPIFLLLISSFFLLIGCKENGGGDNPPPPPPPPSLPSITLDEMRQLYEQCDYIDFIFYHMDFSMSVNDKSNVQRVVTFVDKAQPPGNLTCPAMGRIVFQSNGEILTEADMHYDKECAHLVFYKDGKKAYTNKLTDQGRAYFKQMFDQIRVTPK